MMKKQIKELGYWLEDRLKDICGEITPDKRLAVILAVLLVFTAGNLYLTFSSFYSWGKAAWREQTETGHIRKLLPVKQDRQLIDSPAELLPENTLRNDKGDSIRNILKGILHHEQTGQQTKA